MSGVQLPKWKSYTLYNPELVHILREPPKAIHTRKKERISESDVQYMIRNDDTRINEGISWLPRGINPMVDVSYSNTGGGSKTTSIAQVQASNPYKLSVFRPPLQRQEDLLPLSRMKHPETAAITNPGIRNGMMIHDVSEVFDKATTLNSIDPTKRSYLSIRPTATYNIDKPMEVFTGGNVRQTRYTSVGTNVGADYRTIDDTWGLKNYDEINNKKLRISQGTNPSTNGEYDRSDNIDINNFIKDNIILKNISPNFSIQIYNPDTQTSVNVNSSVKDRMNIAVQSSLGNPISLMTENGKNIKLKDYQYKIVNTNVGMDKLILVVPSYEYELERNVPLYSLGSNISGYTSNDRYEENPITTEKVKTSANTSMSSGYGRTEAIHDTEHNMNLKGMGATGFSFNNSGSIPSVTTGTTRNTSINNRNLNTKSHINHYTNVNGGLDRYS